MWSKRRDDKSDNWLILANGAVVAAALTEQAADVIVQAVNDRDKLLDTSMSMMTELVKERTKKKPKKQRGIEVQVYGIDDEKTLTHAGTRRVAKIDAATAIQIELDWRKWREKYLEDHPGDYPLRHTKPSVKLAMHPVGKEHEVQWFDMPGVATLEVVAMS